MAVIMFSFIDEYLVASRWCRTFSTRLEVCVCRGGEGEGEGTIIMAIDLCESHFGSGFIAILWRWLSCLLMCFCACMGLSCEGELWFVNQELTLCSHLLFTTHRKKNDNGCNCSSNQRENNLFTWNGKHKLKMQFLLLPISRLRHTKYMKYLQHNVELKPKIAFALLYLSLTYAITRQ